MPTPTTIPIAESHALLPIVTADFPDQLRPALLHRARIVCLSCPKLDVSVSNDTFVMSHFFMSWKTRSAAIWSVWDVFKTHLRLARRAIGKSTAPRATKAETTPDQCRRRNVQFHVQVRSTLPLLRNDLASFIARLSCKTFHASTQFEAPVREVQAGPCSSTRPDKSVRQ
jgi:hypothetical protein